MTEDEQWMQRAIELGKQVQGTTGDNPYVGCVIVRVGQILGEGATQSPGNPHAEIMAIRDAEGKGYSVKGASLYTTVEPCSFYGRTPACALTLIDKEIARVIVGIQDPHPRVQGEGVRLLREAQIEVVENICADAVRLYLKDWLLTHTT